MKRITAVHLLNDRSGSPLVFRQALEALMREGYAVALHTASPDGNGFLSHMEGVAEHPLRYRHSSNKWVTLVFFMLAQWTLFWRLLFSLRRTDIVYVNTLLPMGAALAGWLRGCRVVYHVHEVSLSPAYLNWMLKTVASLTAREVIYVSYYVESKLRLRGVKSHVVYNTLSASFLEAAARVPSPNMHPRFTVLMLCSLKAYKGVYGFLELSRTLPDMQFELVLNASPEAVEAFRQEQQVPANCRLFSATTNTLPFFQRAHVVVNMSHPDGWIETFGLTLLEAMACGRPAISPVVGGPTELITHGLEGYCVDGRQPSEIASVLQNMRKDFRNYVRISEKARQKAIQFGPEHFSTDIIELFAGHRTAV